MGAGAATLVQTPEEAKIVFAMERSAAEGPVPDTSLQALNALRPHLARSLALTSYALKQRMRASVVALDAINVAAAVLNGSRKVIESNEAFSRLGGLLKPGAFGVLKLADGGADGLFQDAFASISRDDVKAVRSIPLSTNGAQEGCVVHVIPLRGNSREVFAGTQALVIAVVAGRATSVGAPILRGLYDLTAAEARLVETVLAGRTLREASSALGISYETARSQIKAVFSKTGCKSQRDLAHKIAPLELQPISD
jgi:DNA-binding CsgD family transcriptional regulator